MIYIYKFANASGYYACNQKQVQNTYLSGALLYAKTKKQIQGLILERLGAQKISFMQYDKTKKDFVVQSTIQL